VKILMTTHYFASHQGGIEIVAGQLFRELAAAKQEVVWMASDVTPPPEATGTSRAAGLRTYNFVERKIGLPAPIPTFAAMRKTRAEVRQADLLIVHDCLYLTNILAYAWARLSGIPVVVVQHIGNVPYSSRFLSGVMKLANRWITRNMLRGAEQVVFISETTKEYFKGISFRTPPVVIFNGVDSDVFRPLHFAEKKVDLRREFGLPADRPVILFVGRFVEKKGLLALQRMVEMAPDYTWAFAGWGPLDPGKWGAPNVHIFSDLHDSRLAALYRACDLLVLPSTGEGFPLVLQEALATGLAALCGTETLAADPDMARFVRGAPVFPDNSERTARAFLTSIADYLSSEAAGENESGKSNKSNDRRTFAVSRYSWHHAAGQYMEIAARLAASPVSSSVAMGASAGDVAR